MRTEDEKRLAGELFAHRDDEAEWSDQAEKLVVSRTPSVVYSVRFNRAEIQELRAAADAQGVSLSGLIRRAVLTHVRESGVPNASVSQVGKGLLLRWPNLPGGPRTRNLEPENPVPKRGDEAVTSAGAAPMPV